MNIVVFAENILEVAGFRQFLNNVLPDKAYTEVLNFSKLPEILVTKQADLLIYNETTTDTSDKLNIIRLIKIHPNVIWLLVLAEFSPEKDKFLLEGNQNVSILLKISSEEEFNAALKSLINRNRYICSHVSNLILNSREKSVEKNRERKLLTATETEILKDISLGKTTKEIAAKRNVSVHTVMTHRKNIFRKIEVNTVYEASKYAMRAGIVEMTEYYI